MRSFWLPSTARMVLLALAFVLAACGTGGPAAAPTLAPVPSDAVTAPTPVPAASHTPLAAPTQPAASTAAAAPSATLPPTKVVPGATSQASASTLLIRYHKAGGIAGVDETLDVYADGTLQLRDRRGATSAKANSSDIQELQKLLDSPAFAALQVPMHPPGADQFIYELTVANRSQPIVTTEGVENPQVLRDLIGALEQMKRQAK